jgi:valyl-tRNA synthetase
MVSAWPTFSETHKEIADKNRFELVKGIISEIRNIRAVYHIEPATKMVVSVWGASERTLRDNEEIFKRLARVSEIKTLDDNASAPENSLLIQAGLLQVFLHLEGIVDIAKERDRLTKEKEEKEKYIATLEAKLANSNFIERAKAEVVETERLKFEETRKQLADLDHHLASLS